MSYRHVNRWQRPALTFLAIILLIILGAWGRELLTSPLIFLARPFWQASDNLGEVVVTQIGSLTQSKSSLVTKNKNLREENRQLKNLLLAKNNIEADNLKLRTILGRVPDQTKSIVARVIFLPNFVPYNNLLLDLGKNNTTLDVPKVGDLVVADGVVLIGRLIEVANTYSRTRLISAEANLAVVIGSENIPATAVGSGTGNFTIILPKDIPIIVGDRVVAPLLRNYLIGTVGHIEKLASRPTQTILVRTSANLWQLKWVEIYDPQT